MVVVATTKTALFSPITHTDLMLHYYWCSAIFVSKISLSRFHFKCL